MVDEKDIETVARAICCDSGPCNQNVSMCQATRLFADDARAAIAALEAAGWRKVPLEHKIVPYEPTLPMTEAYVAGIAEGLRRAAEAARAARLALAEVKKEKP